MSAIEGVDKAIKEECAKASDAVRRTKMISLIWMRKLLGERVCQQLCVMLEIKTHRLGLMESMGLRLPTLGESSRNRRHKVGAVT